MTALHHDLPRLLSANMVDSMEITSDSGHIAAEDDIDIDIDLETDQLDEDHILEDAAPDSGPDDNLDYHNQAYPAAENDDLMVDDDSTSFPMDDVDVVPQDDVNDFHTENVRLIDTAESTLQDSDQNNFQSTEFTDYDANEDGQNQDESSEHTETLGSFGPVVGLEHTPPDAYVSLEGEIGEHTQQTGVSRSPTPNSTLQKSPTNIATSPSAESPLEVITLPLDVHSSSSGSEDHASTDVKQDGHEEMPQTEKEKQAASLSRSVVVIYQDVEYALIRTSEEDNPDSFFLKDSSLTNSPLPNLIAALREVLGDDLSPDDELTLAVEDLGLELTEQYSKTAGISLSQIVTLQTNLLWNDGVSTPGPFYVTLSAQPEFSKRFTLLTERAAQGKGLSDLVLWDNESHIFEGEDEEEEDIDDTEENYEENPHEDNADADEDDQIVTNQQESNTSAPNVPTDLDAAQISNHGEYHDNLIQVQDINNETNDAGNYPETDTSNDSLVDPQTNDTRATHSYDGVDEDGDLIDYEDEDDGQASKNPVSGGLILDDGEQFSNECMENLLLLEYDLVNVDLRRNSSLCALDDSKEALNQIQNNRSSSQVNTNVVVPPSEEIELNGASVDLPGSPYGEEVQYDEHDADDQGEEQNFDQIEHNGDRAVEKEFSTTIDKSGELGSRDGEIAHENNSASLPQEDLLDEIDYDQNDVHVNSAVAEKIGLDDNSEAPDPSESDVTAAISLAAGNAEVTATAYEDDEIDYNDDEIDETTPAEPTDIERTLQPLNGQTGKRSRTEAESALDLEDKEPKRVRS